MDWSLLLSIVLIGYVFLNILGKKGIQPLNKIGLSKLSELFKFSEGKVKQVDKIQKIQDDDVEEHFNVIEVDFNRGKGRYLERVNSDEHAYVLNPDVRPLYMENAIPIGVPIRIVQKNLARDLTGFIWDVKYKLNPSCPDLKRLLDMKILKAFLIATKNTSEGLIWVAIILGVLNLAFMYFGIYAPLQETKEIASAGAKASGVIFQTKG